MERNINLIVGEDATLWSLCELNNRGFEFVIEDGKITQVLIN
ncbi:MAG: hypothetical protein ACI4DU_04460 [Lachnospiraceae bacterium]